MTLFKRLEDVTPEDLFYGGNISTSPSIIDNLIVEGDETATVTNLNNQFDGTPFTFSEAIWGQMHWRLT